MSEEIGQEQFFLQLELLFKCLFLGSVFLWICQVSPGQSGSFQVSLGQSE